MASPRVWSRDDFLRAMVLSGCGTASDYYARAASACRVRMEPLGKSR